MKKCNYNNNFTKKNHKESSEIRRIEKKITTVQN